MSLQCTRATLLWCLSFSLWWLLIAQALEFGLRSGGAWASHCGSVSCCGPEALEREGFSGCNTWTQQLRLLGSRAQAQQLRLMGLAALWHVGSSPTKDWTWVPCTARWILNHRTTKEAPQMQYLKCFIYFLRNLYRVFKKKTNPFKVPTKNEFFTMCRCNKITQMKHKQYSHL